MINIVFQTIDSLKGSFVDFLYGSGVYLRVNVIIDGVIALSILHSASFSISCFPI